jgi:hypothetical protein
MTARTCACTTRCDRHEARIACQPATARPPRRPDSPHVDRQATFSEPKHIISTDNPMEARRPRRPAMQQKNQLPSGRILKCGLTYSIANQKILQFATALLELD